MDGESRYEQWLKVIERLERDAKNFTYDGRFKAQIPDPQGNAVCRYRWCHTNVWANSWEEAVWALTDINTACPDNWLPKYFPDLDKRGQALINQIGHAILAVTSYRRGFRRMAEAQQLPGWHGCADHHAVEPDQPSIRTR
jgi:hypothetical protein